MLCLTNNDDDVFLRALSVMLHSTLLSVRERLWFCVAIMDGGDMCVNTSDHSDSDDADGIVPFGRIDAVNIVRSKVCVTCIKLLEVEGALYSYCAGVRKYNGVHCYD